MTRSTSAAGVAGSRYLGYGFESPCCDFSFDRALRHEEASANERFISDPVFASGIAVFANGGQQRVARQFRTVLSAGLAVREILFKLAGVLPNQRSFRRR